ncbi:hypothetical protein [Saccharothrix sp. HUAS TT1]|uniref:hypothetical protein n=1 Tax=unclassified Saccharothrix TaxID=2593673 RepID=UPI00345C3BC6
MTDIKRSLAAAFEDEPPLTIDKAAILRDGRRKATFRRGYAAVAVLATVTAVAVPAVLWSGAGGGSGGVQAATEGASTTAPPLTTGSAPVTTTGQPAVSSTTRPGSSNPPSSFEMPKPPKPVTPERASQLGALLAASGAIPADARAEAVPQDPMDPWTFRISNSNAYLSFMNVTTSVGRGSLLLHLYPGDARCDVLDTTCQEVPHDGRTVAVSTQEHDGVTLITVRTATPDGAVMSAQTSNSSDKATGNGTPPPLTPEQLTKIATSPGFTF